MLLFGKTVYRNELSMTVLICSAVTTSVLGIKVYTYVKVLLAAVLLDGLLYIPVSLLFLEYETRWLILADDVLLCAFLVGVAVVFENLHCDIWKREAEKEDLLKQAFGAAGIVARLGGDEFLAIISALDVRSLIKMVQGFLNRYPRVIKEEVKVSVSVGIALRPVGSIKTYGEICKEADAAMYEAKRLGKGKAFLSACCLTEEIEIAKEEKWNETEGAY